jgi:hypothetical protein
MLVRCWIYCVRRLALVPVKLLLEVGLSVGRFRQMRQRNFELPTANNTPFGVEAPPPAQGQVAHFALQAC